MDDFMSEQDEEIHAIGLVKSIPSWHFSTSKAFLKSYVKPIGIEDRRVGLFKNNFTGREDPEFGSVVFPKHMAFPIIIVLLKTKNILKNPDSQLRRQDGKSP